jgi:RNA 3'-terminal phosphate cyclase (ATP)
MHEQGHIESIDGIAFSSHLKDREVSSRMAGVCRNILSKKGYRVNIREEYDGTAKQPGAALAVYARTSTHCVVGADRAGAPGRRSEAIGRFVAHSLIEDVESGATVDRYLADQLIIYAALAHGVTEYRIPFMTDHIDTNIWLVEKLLGCRVELNNTVLRITGIGYTPK